MIGLIAIPLIAAAFSLHANHKAGKRGEELVKAVLGAAFSGFAAACVLLVVTNLLIGFLR